MHLFLYTPSESNKPPSRLSQHCSGWPLYIVPFFKHTSPTPAVPEPLSLLSPQHPLSSSTAGQTEPWAWGRDHCETPCHCPHLNHTINKDSDWLEQYHITTAGTRLDKLQSPTPTPSILEPPIRIASPPRPLSAFQNIERLGYEASHTPLPPKLLRHCLWESGRQLLHWRSWLLSSQNWNFIT